MRKVVLCLLTVLLFVSPIVRAEDGTVRVVAFEELGDLVLTAAPRYQAELRALAQQEATLADLTRQHAALMSNWQMSAQQIMSLQTTIKTLRTRIDEVKEALPAAARQYTTEARALYLNHFTLSLDVEIALRAVDTARTAHTTARQKYAAGFITQTALAAAEETVRTREDLVKAAHRKVSDNLLALADYLGLDEEISLAGLPEMDVSLVAQRNLDADLAAHLACNAAIIARDKAVQDAQDAYDEDDSHLNRHLLAAAKEDLAAATAAATRAFPRLHEALLDSLDALNSAAALPQAARALQTAKALYAVGRLSKSALTAAHTALADASARHAQQSIALWTMYLEYKTSLAET